MAVQADDAWIGYTDPDNTSWETYTGPNSETSGLYVDVDFTNAGFTKVPFITANLIGEEDTWVMQVSVLMTTPTTARIYVRSTVSAYTPTVTDASDGKWSVTYWAAEPVGINTLPPMTWGTDYEPCDMS